jgi:hypothetical protein
LGFESSEYPAEVASSEAEISDESFERVLTDSFERRLVTLSGEAMIFDELDPFKAPLTFPQE